MTDLSWMDAALCAQVDGDAWAPPAGGSNRAAVQICQRCVAITACLEHALAHPGIDGVWGATSERQRQRIRAARRAA